MSSTAQDEFNALVANNSYRSPSSHPEDVRHRHHRSRSRSRSHSRSASDRDDRYHDTSSADSSDNDEVKSSARTTPVIPSAVYTIPSTTHFDANTGPKGVIADAKSYEQARKRSFRKTLTAFSNGISATVFSDKPRAPSPSRSSRSRGSSSGAASPDGSSDEKEEEFVRTWRQKRMSEMQASRQHDHRTRRLSPSKRRYGHVATVDALGYLDAVDKVTNETIVVVLIYDDQSAVSGIVEDAIGGLARKHEFTRFVKMHYDEAEVDPVSVPSILAYQGGDLIANLTSVIDEIPADRHMSVSSLEALLKERKVLF